MSERIYGIDLGTSTSAVSWASERGIHPIPARDGGPAASRLTPSEVGIVDSSSTDGVAVVGRGAQEAHAAAGLERSRFYRLFKREIALKTPPPEYREPFLGPPWEPVCLSALVLRKLAGDVEATGSALERAVITYPQHFAQPAKLLTREAARIAGIDVALQVSEPYAAAFELGYGTRDFEGFALVVDIGGGTLDVNLFDVRRGSLEVAMTYGDAAFGGADFDELVFARFLTSWLENHGVRFAEVATRPEALTWRREATRVKELLSTLPEVEAELSAGGLFVFPKVTRANLSESAGGHVARVAACAENVVAGVGWDNVKEVALIGGSAHLPPIRDWFAERARGRIKEVERPQDVVVNGAARLAHRLEREGEVGVAFGAGVKLSNRLPRGIGILVGARGAERAHLLIDAGTVIPYQHGQTFRTIEDGSTRIELTIVEVDPHLPDRHLPVGPLHVDAPTPLPRRTPVRVDFALDLGGSLEVTVSGAATGGGIRTTLHVGGPSREQAERAARIPVVTRWP